jgi:serpin B
MPWCGLNPLGLALDKGLVGRHRCACVPSGSGYHAELMSTCATLAAASVAFLASEGAFGFDASSVDGAVKASNAFAFDFYLQARKGQGNFVCSPVGVATALTMAAAGAQGETKAEILHALHVDPQHLDQTYRSFAAILTPLKDAAEKYSLARNVATGVWMRRGLQPRPAYGALLRDVFRAPVREVSFDDRGEAVTAINQWASDETHGRVPQILARPGGRAPIVLANVAYMSGRWREFEATREAKFSTPAQRTAVRIKTMHQFGHFGYAEVDGAKLIDLPYVYGSSMVVLLPDDSDGLEKLENRLGGHYAEWVGALEPQEVSLELPGFETTTALSLVDLLKAMGIRQAFDRRQASFSEMVEPPAKESDGQTPYLGDAIQKVRIEAGATVRKKGYRERFYWGWRQPPVTFQANHPFMYVVRDLQSGAILFMGRVVRPAE